MQDHWKSYFIFSIKEQKGIIVLGLVLLLSIIISMLLPKPILKEKLEAIPNNSNLLLDIEQAEFIDKDVIDTINEFIEHAHLKDIDVSIKKNQNNPMHHSIHTQRS